MTVVGRADHNTKIPQSIYLYFTHHYHDSSWEAKLRHSHYIEARVLSVFSSCLPLIMIIIIIIFIVIVIIMMIMIMIIMIICINTRHDEQ